MSLYGGLFLIAFAMLAVEISLLRLLSAISWYHLAFFTISTAMLGMTAGATTVYLKPLWFSEERLNSSLARASFGFTLAVPLSLLVLCLTPLELFASVVSLFVFLVATVACALPFYFSGVVITAVLTKGSHPIGRLYASDLIGAALGCLFVLVGLEFLDAPSFILLSGAIGIPAGLVFARHEQTRRARRNWLVVFGLLVILSLVNAATLHGVRPLVVKGALDFPRFHLLEKWNSFSRVVVFREAQAPPHYWGPSPMAPRTTISQYPMQIDGAALTSVRQFKNIEDIVHLRFDLPNLAYYIRPTGGACIIGSGGGRDVQSALLFGHRRVHGIEVNPILVGLVENRFREFAGLADHEGVSLVVDEARSHLSRSNETYAVIQMSMIDTWAATGAGAYTLSENSLYTVQAWKIYLSRLSSSGVFTVSRWHSPSDLGETGRLVSLAVATLLESGVQDPSRHLAMFTTGYIANLMVSKNPLTRGDLSRLQSVAAELRFEPVLLPGHPPSNEVLKNILAARSMAELEKAVAGESLNYRPPTDEDPYFFNMLRLSHLGVALSSPEGVLAGNLVATLTLVGLIIALLVLCILTIVVPLIVGSRSATTNQSGVLWPAALYFALIGAGFMFVEIGLVQRLSVFLGHPVYALGILLFTIILSTGLGSLISDRLPLIRQPWLMVYPVATVVAILGVQFLLLEVMTRMMEAPIPSRILASILLIFPLGLLMGLFFPTGMRLVQVMRAAETPWYWALNGIFGVLSSALAVFVSIYSGISSNFYIAAACYAAILVCLHFMRTAGTAATDCPNPSIAQ